MDETRYAEVTEVEYAVLTEVRNQWFSYLSEARIRILFDLRKKLSSRKIVLARIYKTNDLIKHLTLTEQEAEGTDFIIFLDKVCWDAIPQPDRIRVIRHELRHAEVIDKKNPFIIIGHDIEDFESEVQLNQDDIGWRRRVATLTEIIYQQREEAEKEAKKQAKGPRKRRGVAVTKLL